MTILAGFPAGALSEPCTITVGVFDGMHIGHQRFLSELATAAHTRGEQAVVVTFDPHPDSIVHPDRYRGLLLTPHERYERIHACGIDVVQTIAFTDEIRRRSAADFMAALCQVMPVRTVWIGWDFALGRDRDGTFSRLSMLGDQLGYQTLEFAKVGGTRPVSASTIRDALAAGDIDTVTQALGRRHEYDGVVVHGDKRGRTIGFPTANISIDPRLLLPKFGVYATVVHIDGVTYPSVTNIGIRPTFGGVEPRVEAHLLDVTVDVYDRPARIELIAFLRGEQRFAGLDALIAQITADAAAARSQLGVS
jgi:riboflavin kinase/FMN adenylyltransferase